MDRQGYSVLSVKGNGMGLKVGRSLWVAVAGLIVSWGTVGAASPQPSSQKISVVTGASPAEIRYVAVGDSYTCGTGATPEQAWPAVLARDLRANGVKIRLAANLGVDGWTTEDALRRELPSYRSAAPTFATLMIGVNDTYRATTPETFRTHIRLLLDRMQATLPDKARLIVLTIPDFSVTPTGAQYANQNNARRKIEVFNVILQDEARARGVPLVDIYPLSQQMTGDSGLIAYDRLHPSAKEYALWEKLIFPLAYGCLRATTSACR